MATDQGNSKSTKEPGSSKRGFAAMDEAAQRQIASKGGQSAHLKGSAHEFASAEARRAGQKGGEAVSRDREHMAAIGRKGGASRQSLARENNAIAANTARGVSEQQAQAGRQQGNMPGKS